MQQMRYLEKSLSKLRTQDQSEDEDKVQPENTLETMLARAIVKALDCNLSAKMLHTS